MENNLKDVQSEEVEAVNAVEPAPETEMKEVRTARVLSPMQTVLKRFFRSKLSVIGLVMIVALFLFSFAGPLFTGWGEAEKDKDLSSARGKITVERLNYVALDENGIEVSYTAYIISEAKLGEGDYNARAGISARHLLGTDDLGQDVLTRLMYGGRVSLTIGFVVIIIETLIGVLLGGLAGYFGGWVDNVVMRVVDILYCVPTLPIMLILSAMFDSLAIVKIEKLYYMMLILCAIGWAGTARLVRGQILTLREQEFMLAAKAAGLSVWKKIFKHLLPNVIPQLIVTMTLGLGGIILTEATLGFLNIGAPLNTATWGSMINSAQSVENLTLYPNFWLPAGICITLAILAFNFVGDGLRDAFDPKMKR